MTKTKTKTKTKTNDDEFINSLIKFLEIYNNAKSAEEGFGALNNIITETIKNDENSKEV